MEQKIELLRNRLNNVTENAELTIMRIQGVFKAKLIQKHFHDDELSEIDVLTLENENSDYEKGQIIRINLNGGELIEIEIGI
mgnify:CR=1 FL=1|tara:strand:+ start:258 stop:503 length:246 start_codon:yes stop_codon:yes gene_type:complete